MDFNEIKNLIEIDGGKFIIVENGKPTMVISSFEEYKKKVIGNKISPVRAGEALFVSKQSLPKELESEPLKLEDLPL